MYKCFRGKHPPPGLRGPKGGDLSLPCLTLTGKKQLILTEPSVTLTKLSLSCCEDDFTSGFPGRPTQSCLPKKASHAALPHRGSPRPPGAEAEEGREGGRGGAAGRLGEEEEEEEEEKEEEGGLSGRHPGGGGGAR